MLEWAKYPAIRLRDRWRAASTTRLIIDLGNLASTLYILYASTRIALNPISEVKYVPNLWLFGGTSIYALLHKYLLKERPGAKKWVHQDRQRKLAIANAVNRLAECVYSDQYTELDLSQCESYVLRAMLSHVETTVGDVEGIYLNVNLIVPDPARRKMLTVINRATTTRGLYISYRESELLVGVAMKTGDVLYKKDHNDPNKPYRSILVLPINYEAGGKRQCLGAASIDSSRRDHLGPYLDELNVSLLPHLANLRMVLLLRRKRNLWR
jgi:hypothetical protein